MTEALTLDERRRQVEQQQEEVNTRLAELVAERSTLGLRALEGEEDAVARVEEIDKEIAELESRRHLVESALEEIRQLEQEEQRQQEEQHRQELAEKWDQLVGERRKVLQKFERALNSLKDAAAAVLETDKRQRT